MNDIGIENAERHILDLGDRLIEGLRRLGARIVTPLDRGTRSGVITFRLRESEAEDTALRERLMVEGILISVRDTSDVGGLRVSVHYFNDDDDIGTLLERLEHR